MSDAPKLPEKVERALRAFLDKWSPQPRVTKLADYSSDLVGVRRAIGAALLRAEAGIWHQVTERWFTDRTKEPSLTAELKTRRWYEERAVEATAQADALEAERE